MTDAADPLVFFKRKYPSANAVLVRGDRPVLVDTGFGSDLNTTERLLREAGVAPEHLHLVVNTHYHCDHAGGNSGLQRRYDLPIAAHRWEADLVNRRDREACSAEWLNQPIEPYEVSFALSGGDEIQTGAATLRVLHTLGHTLGLVSLYEPKTQTLICGDAVHGDDVAPTTPSAKAPGRYKGLSKASTSWRGYQCAGPTPGTDRRSRTSEPRSTPRGAGTRSGSKTPRNPPGTAASASLPMH